MAKIKSTSTIGMGVKRLPELEMMNIIGRCVERSLQKHIDAIVEKNLDVRVEKLITGLVVDLMQTADIAALPLPDAEPATTTTKNDNLTLDAAIEQSVGKDVKPPVKEKPVTEELTMDDIDAMLSTTAGKTPPLPEAVKPKKAVTPPPLAPVAVPAATLEDLI